jgi:hypothetical protein
VAGALTLVAMEEQIEKLDAMRNVESAEGLIAPPRTWRRINIIGKSLLHSGPVPRINQN